MSKDGSAICCVSISGYDVTFEGMSLSQDAHFPLERSAICCVSISGYDVPGWHRKLAAGEAVLLS